MSDPMDVAATPTGDGETSARHVPTIGIWSWSFVGFTVAMVIIVFVMAALSEIVLPMTFAAVLAVMFRPLVGSLQRRGLKPTLAAGLVVLGLLAVAVGVFTATVKGVVDQADQIGELADEALDKAADQVDELGVDEAALEDARAATEEAGPVAAEGALTHLVDLFDSLFALASGMILGSLIMYYLLKDGSKFRQAVVVRVSDAVRDDVDGFIGDSCRNLRSYGKGRSIMSAIVSAVIGLASLLMGLPIVFTIMVVNFVGGYIPYIGAFLGGGLAVIVALGDGGISQAALMLVIVLASNLLLENFVEPKVMSTSLDIHPLVVLVVTALGGLVGGIVGLILAVPAYVIIRDGLARLRSRGVVDKVTEAAEPAVQKLLT